MKMKIQQLKTYERRKSNSKIGVYSNTILPQETRKTSNRQYNFPAKATGKRREKKISRRKEIIKI